MSMYHAYSRWKGNRTLADAMGWGKYARPATNQTRYTPKRRYYKKSYRKVPKRFKKNLLALKENKFVNDTSIQFTPVSGTSQIEYITGIPQGDTDFTRDGNDVYVTSFQVKGKFEGDADQATDRFIKLMLVLKRDVRGTILGIGELLESDDYDAMRELDNSKNFKILKTVERNIKVATTTGDTHKSRCDFYYKFKNPLRVKFLGGTANIDNADRNALFLVCMTTGGVADSPNLTIQSRLIFKDV